MSSTVPGLATLAKIANRRRPGRTSRKSSRRLEVVSTSWPDRPVTLPPGCARLRTRPVPTGSFVAANLFGGDDCWGSRRNNEIDFEPHEFGRDLGEALVAALRPAILDCEVVTLDPTELAQPLHKRGDPVALNQRRGRAQKPDGRLLARLLRPRRERPRNRAAEQRYERAPPHVWMAPAWQE